MSTTKIGYCRVSTTNQNSTPQLDLLHNAGCEEIFQEQLSGKNSKRPELRKMLDYIRKGDMVIVTKLDRLARSTNDLLNIAEEIKNKNADLKILNIHLDTKSPTGKLMLTMLGAIAEFEREIMLERQREGIIHAKKDGKYKGRKPIKNEIILELQSLIASGMSVTKAVSEVGIARRTYYNALQRGHL